MFKSAGWRRVNVVAQWKPSRQDRWLLITDLPALRTAADEFGYTLLAVSIESWHAHWLIDHGYDAVPAMVGRLKTRIRQSVGRGRI